MNNQQNQNKKQNPVLKYTVVIIFIAIVIFAFYLTFLRYKWIGQAVQRGDFKTAGLLFIPEIGSATASIIGYK